MGCLRLCLDMSLGLCLCLGARLVKLLSAHLVHLVHVYLIHDYLRLAHLLLPIHLAHLVLLQMALTAVSPHLTHLANIIRSGSHLVYKALAHSQTVLVYLSFGLDRCQEFCTKSNEFFSDSIDVFFFRIGALVDHSLVVARKLLDPLVAILTLQRHHHCEHRRYDLPAGLWRHFILPLEVRMHGLAWHKRWLRAASGVAKFHLPLLGVIAGRLAVNRQRCLD